jgi:hypothetical protein
LLLKGIEPAGIDGSWLQCNIQVACHAASKTLLIIVNGLQGRTAIDESPPPFISGKLLNN